MSLSETDTSDNCLYCCLAVPLSGFGNVRVMPFCPPIPPLPLINCFTISLLLYKRQFLSTQAYWMWQTCLLRPICLSVLRQGQGTFVMLTGVPDLSVAQLSLLAWYTLLSTSKLYCFAHAFAKRYMVCRHTDILGWWQHVAISQSWQYAEVPTRENCLSVLQAIKAEALMTCIPVSQHTRFMSVQQTCKHFTAHPYCFNLSSYLFIYNTSFLLQPISIIFFQSAQW